jgi:hypothetical protein
LVHIGPGDRLERTFGNIVGVGQSLGGRGEGQEALELYHSTELGKVQNGFLYSLALSGHFLLDVDLEERVPRSIFEEDVGEVSGHFGQLDTNP